jgi:hypothetical protein
LRIDRSSAATEANLRASEGFAWLELAIEDRSLNVSIMGPVFAELRSDPRFNRVRDRLGLAARPLPQPARLSGSGPG